MFRSLKTLDMSYNFISDINALSESTRNGIQTKFSLNALHLEYNDIKRLSEEDFQKFVVINRTFFDGNPITRIQVSCKLLELQKFSVLKRDFTFCGAA